MSTAGPTPCLDISALPNPALLHIFQLVCDSWPPHSPGTCWLAPVCKQWRRLASQVKGLRVLFQGEQEQQVGSFRAWLRRYAGRVKALAITSDKALQVLRALAAAAAIAAAASKPLPLQRLVVTRGQLLDPEVCEDVLQPLLLTLPHLQHLHVSLAAPVHVTDEVEAAIEAAAGALGPLQHSTNLTSLVLDGPKWVGGSEAADAAHVQLLASLPPSLRSLRWTLHKLECPAEVSFRHLTGLAHLCLVNEGPDMDDDFSGDAFTGLQHLCKLELLLDDFLDDDDLLAVQQQLVGLAPGDAGTEVLAQLTHLQSLDLRGTSNVRELLQQAPQLQQLSVALEVDRPGDLQGWSAPWVLRHYSSATSLQRLELDVFARQAAPLELCALRQLKQLTINIRYVASMEASHLASWAAALAGLVNLEVLTVPLALTACPHPWLTGLPRLVVLEVVSDAGVGFDLAPAISHLIGLLTAGSRHMHSGASSSSQPGEQLQPDRVQVVCWNGSHNTPQAALLRNAVSALAPLPPNKHVFRGSWQQLQECGLELWPAPVAARLQQLLLR